MKDMPIDDLKLSDGNLPMTSCESCTVKQAIEFFENAEKNGGTCTVKVAGNIVAMRAEDETSHMRFIDIGDSTGTIQVHITEKNLGEDAYRYCMRLCPHDGIMVEGTMKCCNGSPTIQATKISLLRVNKYNIRLEKLKNLQDNNQDPFRANCQQSHTVKQAIELFEKAEKHGGTCTVEVAGRIVKWRDMGKISFMDLLDQTGRLQVYIADSKVGVENYKHLKTYYDIGDFIGVKGEMFRTKTGAITVAATETKLVSKSLRSLPDKFHGLNNPDTIYRQRYLDLIVNQASRERFLKRSAIIRAIREFLWKRDFVDVETPVLHDVAGGAAAQPFVTHFNALDRDFYLRISLELYLKRMLVAGWDRVFEIGRVFRNEGLSRRHNPEFTMMELYQAYSDYRGMMTLVRELIQHLWETVIEKKQVKGYNKEPINLSGEWEEITYEECIRTNIKERDWFLYPKEEKLRKCKELNIEVNPNLEDFEITNNVFEKVVAPTLVQPTFVTELPKELCPLAKLTKDGKHLDVFELYINGQEIAPAYSEQNDPLLQRKMFEWQAGEEKQKIDEDFLTALEYGMPPAGGIGIGIDRLCVLLTEADNIRDTLLYPTLKRDPNAPNAASERSE